MAPIFNPLVEPFLSGIRRRVAELIRDTGCRMALDVCCGTGRQCLLLHSMGIRAVGVDISPSMLAAGMKEKPPSVHYLLQDATQLGLARQSFPCVIVSLALHEKSAEGREALLREVLRVLQPQGYLFLVDFALPDSVLGRIIRGGILASEFLMGSEHYKNFRSYTLQGGLPEVIAGLPLKHVSRYSCKKGNVEISVLTPEPCPH